MNNAEKYFEEQKQNAEFAQSYNEISQQVDISAYPKIKRDRKKFETVKNSVSATKSNT